MKYEQLNFTLDGQPVLVVMELMEKVIFKFYFYFFYLILTGKSSRFSPFPPSRCTGKYRKAAAPYRGAIFHLGRTNRRWHGLFRVINSL